MKGLILKDIINLKQQTKIYLIIIAIWGILAFANKDSAFFGGVMLIFTAIVPITAMSYDEKAKWDRYGLTMPVSKTDMVLSKYLLSLFCSVVGAVLSSIVGIIISKDIVSSLISSMVFLSLGLIFASIILPINFKFGVEKGRMLMLTIILVPNIIALLLPRMNVSLPSEAEIEKLIYFLPFIVAFIIVVSIFISKVIYEHKEI